MKINSSRGRLGTNRIRRARIEFSDSSFAGRSAKSRLKMVNRLADSLGSVNNYGSFSGNKSATIIIAKKRKKAAAKLMAARKVSQSKVPLISKPLSALLLRSAGWKPKSTASSKK